MSEAEGRSRDNSVESAEVEYADIVAAATRLRDRLCPTPVLTAKSLNQQLRADIFFKCENFQKTGSFKVRGATNAVLNLSPAQRQHGIMTYSSGNHAQAIAWIAQQLQIPATIVMPNDAPSVKQAATQGYGAEVVLYDRATTNRETLAQDLAQTRQLTLIPPYDHPHVIAGQGTAAKELIEEVGPLDLLLVPCGGGGLLSGCAIAARALAPQCQVIGVEPKLADDATRSFYTQTLQTLTHTNTIADGARTPALGRYTFPLILQFVNDMVTVSDAAILRAMFYLWERLKIVVEPTGAVAFAALLEGVVARPHARIGVILSGGNVDLKQASQLFAKLNTRNTRSKAVPPRPLAQEFS